MQIEMLTVKEAANYLGITTAAVYAAVKAGKLFPDPDLAIRGIKMFAKNEVERYKAKRWGRSKKRRLT